MSKISALIRKITVAVREVWLIPVKLYRKFLSPLKVTSSCRFTPTCSAYAVDAVRRWGIIVGTALAVWRVLRCNPFGKGGYDPVPTPPWEKIERQNESEKTR